MASNVQGTGEIPPEWNDCLLSINPVNGEISASPCLGQRGWDFNLEVYDLETKSDDILITVNWSEAGGSKKRAATLHRSKYKDIIRQIISDNELAFRITEDWVRLNRLHKLNRREEYDVEMDYLKDLYNIYGSDDENETAMIITSVLHNITSNLIVTLRLDDVLREFSPVYFRILK